MPPKNLDLQTLTGAIANELSLRSAELRAERTHLVSTGRYGHAEARRLRRDATILTGQLLRLLELQCQLNPTINPCSTQLPNPFPAATPEDVSFLQQLDRLSEEELQEMLTTARFPTGFRCGRCGNENGQPITNRRAIRCRTCGRFSGLLNGTPLARTHLAIKTWLKATWALARNPNLPISTLCGLTGVNRAASVARLKHTLSSLPALQSVSRRPLTLSEVIQALVGSEDGRQA